MRLNVLLAAVLALFLQPCFANSPDERQPDLPPRKGDVTKNVHVLFDVSASLTTDGLARAYGEVQLLVMQGTDEFNLAVTAFAAGHARMTVSDPDCKLKPNWMGMPSAAHYKSLMSWLKGISLPSWNTRIDTALRAIIKENKENVTIIVISDCDITNFSEAIALVQAARKTKGHHPFKMGFVNVSDTMGDDVYNTIKKNKFWYVNVAPREEPEEREEDDWSVDAIEKLFKEDD